MPEISELYAKYFDDVYRYALTLCHNESTAEEITQETFFKALKGIDGFDGRCRVYVWLCEIAKNTWFTLQKKESRLEGEEKLEEMPAPDDLERAILDKTELPPVYRALHSLPDPYKEVVTLRVLGDLPFRQIAELFGKTESWARVTFYRAKSMMRRMTDESDM